jgi:hypothetical protein
MKSRIKNRIDRKKINIKKIRKYKESNWLVRREEKKVIWSWRRTIRDVIVKEKEEERGFSK